MNGKQEKNQFAVFVDRELNEQFVKFCKQEQRTRPAMIRYLMMRAVKDAEQ